MYLIHIRSYKPLSISFPAPGVYEGEVGVILPSLDPSGLSRLSDEGGNPLMVKFTLDRRMTAAQLRQIIVTHLADFQTVSERYAHTLRQAPNPYALRQKERQGPLVNADVLLDESLPS